jgi:ribose 5-phosphate isomerase B
MKGIFAGVCHDTFSARQGVEHDDMNVLCLGARVIGIELAKELVAAFLAAEFSQAERHVRRVAKIQRMENDSV